ncbi:MAG: DUF1266 domain-containing protein [Lachnospiraceae bacterium]|nr:DUF1266 domain-containing protein [Lachnospiraceae bacterium]
MIGIIIVLLAVCFEMLIGPSTLDAILIFALVILCLVNHFIEKSYTKKVTPTMNFIISCCFLTNRASENDGYEIGGMPKGTVPRLQTRKALKGPWGIKNKRKFNETVHWLLEEGHNKGCLEEMKQYQGHIKESPNPELFQKLLDDYPEKGILAWDLCRLCNVATWGTIAGYIKYKDAIALCVKAGKILQDNFDSWDDMIDNYLTGLWYWSGNKDEMKKRKEWYNIRRNSEKSLLYKSDFKMNLDENDIVKQRISVFL